ncbi:YjaA family stress response protein [Serratia aquatilis]|uniref:YjaA family stress response protein n=1 Tax=Serratia aquatilis TaxID=1737515 RepID=A0ABV6EK67_9GAMM
MPVFYLQVRRNHLTLKELESKKSASGTAAFSTQRLLIGQFFVAEACLYYLVPQFFPGFINQLKRRHLSYRVLVHAQEMLEGGVSQVEQRILQEFIVASFPRADSTVYAGPQTLSDEFVKRIIQLNSDKVITAADLKF